MQNWRLSHAFKISARRACGVVQVHRSAAYYRSRKDRQDFLRMRIRDLAQSRVGYSYRRLHILLLREGIEVNHKRVYRIYGLIIRTKKKRRHKSALKRVELPRLEAPNTHWSMDFMTDQLACGRRIPLLTLVDNFSRASPGISVD